jgi:hypothetical protein
VSNALLLTFSTPLRRPLSTNVNEGAARALRAPRTLHH